MKVFRWKLPNVIIQRSYPVPLTEMIQSVSIVLQLQNVIFNNHSDKLKAVSEITYNETYDTTEIET